jgi:hypothetical protein
VGGRRPFFAGRCGAKNRQLVRAHHESSLCLELIDVVYHLAFRCGSGIFRLQEAFNYFFAANRPLLRDPNYSKGNKHEFDLDDMYESEKGWRNPVESMHQREITYIHTSS